MSRFFWLVRREFWETRAIWIAPVVVLGLLAVVAATGNINLGDADLGGVERFSELSPEQRDEIRDKLERELGDQGAAVFDRLERGEHGSLLALLPEQKQVALISVAYSMLAVLMFIVLGSIAAFYALDALYADRRDRSVLFWKSLPLSDLETVLSKYFVAIVAIPLVAIAASVAAQLVVATGGSIKLALTGGPAALMWSPQALGAGLATAVVFGLVSIMWYAPIVAYLMLASAWAPKAPFLWAVLPPAAALVLERITTGTDHLGDFLVWRLFGPFKAIGGDDSDTPGLVVDSGNLSAAAGTLLERIGGLLLSPSTLLGLAAAALLIAAAIWLRRYREDSI